MVSHSGESASAESQERLPPGRRITEERTQPGRLCFSSSCRRDRTLYCCPWSRRLGAPERSLEFHFHSRCHYPRVPMEGRQMMEWWGGSYARLDELEVQALKRNFRRWWLIGGQQATTPWSNVRWPLWSRSGRSKTLVPRGRRGHNGKLRVCRPSWIEWQLVARDLWHLVYRWAQRVNRPKVCAMSLYCCQDFHLRYINRISCWYKDAWIRLTYPTDSFGLSSLSFARYSRPWTTSAMHDAAIVRPNVISKDRTTYVGSAGLDVWRPWVPYTRSRDIWIGFEGAKF